MPRKVNKETTSQSLSGLFRLGTDYYALFPKTTQNAAKYYGSNR